MHASLKCESNLIPLRKALGRILDSDIVRLGDFNCRNKMKRLRVEIITGIQ